MSCRAARWRIRCHVRSLPPLSSGSSRPAFSQRIFTLAISYAVACSRSAGVEAGPKAGSVWTPSPSMKVRYQSSRLSRLQIASPPSAAPAAWAAISRSTADRLDDAALTAARVEQHVARDGAPLAAHPDPERHRESHLLPRQDLGRDDRLHRLAQDPLGREPAQLQPGRQRRGELDELVIEERHPALDRRRHAHLVLLHQQLDQVGLEVGVEQAVEQRAAAVRRVEVLPATARRRAGVLSAKRAVSRAC